MSSIMKWKKSKTTVHNLSYHIIWTTKYRRDVLSNDEVSTRLKELVEEKCAELEVEIKELSVQPEHVHLFISASPILSVQFIVNQIKGYSSRMLRKEFPKVKSRLPSLWTRSYYVDSVGTLNEYTIRKYINEQ